jgi:hypothetical protein
MSHWFAPKAPVVPTPSQVLTPGQTVQGTQTSRASNVPSFLAAAATPSGQANQGGKTLLGQ